MGRRWCADTQIHQDQEPNADLILSCGVGSRSRGTLCASRPFMDLCGELSRRASRIQITDITRIIMLATFTIYIFAGIDIFKKRRQLREFAYPNNPNAPPLIENPFTSTRTTEVKITRESVEMAPGTILAAPVRPGSVNRSRSSHNGYQPYSITIESNGEEPLTAPTSGPRLARSHSAIETNTAAWGYTRCAFFFFLAMLVTWVSITLVIPYSSTSTSTSSLDSVFCNLYPLTSCHLYFAGPF